MERALACVQCQRRKVRCDRQFPCAHCRRQQMHCVPALAPRQRRRRFPERELLNRLRHYEDLLRQHRIEFDPLHRDEDDTTTRTPDEASGLVPPKAVDIRNAVMRNPGVSNPSPQYHPGHDSGDSTDDDIGDPVIEHVWDQTYHDEEHGLLFAGGQSAQPNLSTMHPDPVRIMRLWQVYLENVNPLLRVTHTPTLQADLLNAIGYLAAITPELEALLFAIYCVAVNSLSDTECSTHFDAASKAQVLSGYQFACRHALLKCRVLRSDSRHCLTALFLYLVSVANNTNPSSLSSTMAVLMHRAQQLGIHSETTLSKHGILEAEMCRRLWWSIVTINHRICELSEYQTTTLLPTWDCKLPLNVHDSELRAEMQTEPLAHQEATEALPTLVRYLQADFIRHASFHLNFVNPSLKSIPTPPGFDDNLSTLERTTESKYLSICDQSIPLHLMAVCSARGLLARNRLLEYYSRQHSSTQTHQQPDVHHEASMPYALNMLNSDTQLVDSHLTKGYLWFVDLHFPMLAYIHLLRYLREQPQGLHSQEAWKSLDANFVVHAMRPKSADAIFAICSKLVLQAWEACQHSNSQQATPQIVLGVHNNVFQTSPGWSPQETKQPINAAVGLGQAQVSALAAAPTDEQQLNSLDAGLLGFEGMDSTLFRGDLPTWSLSDANGGPLRWN